jgi:hypothetical protein
MEGQAVHSKQAGGEDKESKNCIAAAHPMWTGLAVFERIDWMDRDRDRIDGIGIDGIDRIDQIDRIDGIDGFDHFEQFDDFEVQELLS